MRKNINKLIPILILCSLTFGIISLANQSFIATEFVNEKDYEQPKTADTNLKIAVLNSGAYPSYAWGTMMNDYLPMYNGLDSSGFDVILITNADILSGILLTVDVLVMTDNLPSDTASLTVKDWALKGGGILSIDSSIEFLNWAGLIPPESEGSNGFMNYWNYFSPDWGLAVNDKHPVMSGYTYGDNITGYSGDSQYYSDSIMTTSAGPYYTPLVKTGLGSNYDLVVALDAPYCGRVVHIWDQMHWNTTSNRPIILNSIDWIREKFSDVPQTIVINEMYTGANDFIEFYNYGPSINMSNWYVDIYYNDDFQYNYTFPDGWMFNSHQIVTLHETSGTDTSTDLYSGINILWTNGPIAVGLFNDNGENIDWFQTYDHNGTVPVDAIWINDTILDQENNEYIYRVKDLDTNKASDWAISGTGTADSLNPDQKGHFFDFNTCSGPFAIFQDAYPWDYNSTDIILDMYGIPYDIYNSSDFGAVDLSPYQKVIISSDQPQLFYNSLEGNVSWFESYASDGGILEIHGADHGWNSGNWDDMSMPGGLNKTSAYLDNLDINILQHPTVLNPHPINDTAIDNWDASTHGYFDVYPSDSREILQDTSTSDPVLLEFEYENGFIIATMQTLEFAYLWDSPYSPGSVMYENILLYDPSSYYFSDTLNVNTPNGLTSWQTGSSHYIDWLTTGNVSNVKIELYKSGVFETDIATNISNQGEFYWTIPLALDDSTQYQVKVTDVSNSYTYDYSDFFEIYNPTITVTSPEGASSWQKGTEQVISWTSTGTIADVKIELYLDSTFVLELIASTPNDGSYSWSIPANLTSSTLYQVKISDASNPLVYDYSDDFEIFAPAVGGGIPSYNIAILILSIAAVSTILLKKKFKKI